MKNVLITGATGGIGNALVQKFHNAGYNVCASGTNNQKLNSLSDNYSERLLSIQCDLSDNKQIQDLVDKVNK